MRARFWGPTLRPAPTAQGYDWTDVLEGDPPRTIPPAAYAAFANGETRRSELSGSSYPGRVLSSTTFPAPKYVAWNYLGSSGRQDRCDLVGTVEKCFEDLLRDYHMSIVMERGMARLAALGGNIADLDGPAPQPRLPKPLDCVLLKYEIEVTSSPTSRTSAATE